MRGTATVPMTGVEARFWSDVDYSKKCWEWTGAKSSTGYGLFSLNGDSIYAHRWSYETQSGPIAKGMQIDHLCRNRACVRPEHLEVVTQKENILRGESLPAKNARKTHCDRGHPLSGANLYLRKDRHGRMCKACRNASSRARRAR